MKIGKKNAKTAALRAFIDTVNAKTKSKYFEKIFQLFQTLATQDNFESTGVGLTVAKKIVEMYGGRIWLESIPTEGTTFFFTLLKQETEIKNAEYQTNNVS